MTERNGDATAALLDEARVAVGSDNVHEPSALAARYGSSTIGVPLAAAGAVLPGSVAEVQTVVRAAARLGVHIYPVSTGNNWGYGAATPVRPDSVILDLSRLRGIDDSDIDLGVVTLEPGVTQQGLRDWLDARGLRLMVPVHGGGPQCSLVGNLLERGYGITPVTDHFAAVTAIEAVLANGELYRTPLSTQGACTDRLFKWGVGPYVDGLFTQGSFGVVTRASIALAPLPARVENFVFRIAREEDLPRVVTALRAMLSELPGVLHAVNVMNTRRVLSMMSGYPAQARGPEGIVSDAAIAELAARQRVTPWTGFGALYGDRAVVKAARSVVRRHLKGIAMPLFIPAPLVDAAGGMLARLPAGLGASARAYIATLQKSLAVLQGRPSEIALPLAYWKGGGHGDRVGLHPSRDRRGVLWFAPLIALRPAAITRYVETALAICRQHGMEPLLTLTTISERCVDSTIPLLFDPEDPHETARAQQCWRALWQAGKEQGFMPYRYPIHEMAGLVDLTEPYWRMVAALKQAADPAGIISPGRYGP